MAEAPREPMTFRALHESALIRVRDYTCRAAQSGPDREEESAANHVVLMRHGVFTRHFGSRTTTADVNQVAFFSRRSTYRVSHAAESGDRGTIFEVAPHILAEFLRELDPDAADAADPALPFVSGPCDSERFWRHREIVLKLEGAQAEPLEPFWADAASLQLVADVLEAGYAQNGQPRKGRRPGTEADHGDRVEAAKTYLASRMSERLTLGDVAEAANVSPFHLARLFRQRTGVPIHRYLTRLRLRASLERLSEGDLSAVALDLGFASHSHFADAFRREFGCTPSDARGRATGPALARMRKNLKARASGRAPSCPP